MSRLASLVRPCHRSLRALELQPVRRLKSTSSVAPRKQLAFAFDIDGVLKQGSHVLPQAKRALAKLSGSNGSLSLSRSSVHGSDTGVSKVPFLLMTNGGGVTDAERRSALSKDLGVPLGEHQLVQSHTPLRDFVKDWKDRPVLVIGGLGDAARKIAESYGMKQAYILQDLLAWNPSLWDRYRLSEEEKAFVKRDVDFSTIDFEGIFVIHDNGLDWGLATQVIVELMCAHRGRMGTEHYRPRGQSDGEEIPLVFTNPDVIWSTDYPVPRLGMGAFRLGLERIYSHRRGCKLPYAQFGKPHKATYDFADKMLRQHLESLGGDPDQPLSVYMIGDNPASDIKGANDYGWSSVLVRTGVFRGEDLSHPPTHVADDVEAAVDWALLHHAGLIDA